MLKILVADDEKWIRLGTIKMLKDIDGNQEFIIHEADSVSKALSSFMVEQYDVIVCDVKFPVSDGCQLCEEIFKLNPNVKFIMLSGYSDFEYIKQALSFKAVDYLLKPVRVEELQGAIQKCYQELTKYEKEEDNPIISDVIEQIKSYALHNLDKKITLRDLAKMYHVNESYLSNTFSKMEGETITSYITKCKMTRAQQLIRISDLKMNAIAMMVGYDDLHYFTRVFKKTTGQSPSEYRKDIDGRADI